MREFLLQNVLPVVVALLGMGLVAALGLLVSWLKARAGTSRVGLFLGVVLEQARGVVADLELTMRPQVQQALSDGSLTPVEGQALKKAAVDRLLVTLPPAAKRVGQSFFGAGLVDVVGAAVEKAVTEQNLAKAATLGAQTPR